MDKSQVHHRVTLRQKINILTHAIGQLKIPNSPHLHVFGLWKEVKEPGGNPCRHREKKLQEGPEWNRKPSCKEAALINKHFVKQCF